LFPELAGRRGGPDKRLGYYPTKEFTDYRREVDLYAPRLDFHSLRHSFTTALEAAGVPRTTIDELTGHEGTGETSRYTKGLPLPLLRDAVAKVDYGFDLSHLLS
jgi:integrase